MIILYFMILIYPEQRKNLFFQQLFLIESKKDDTGNRLFFQQPPKTGSAFLCIFVTQTLIAASDYWFAFENINTAASLIPYAMLLPPCDVSYRHDQRSRRDNNDLPCALQSAVQAYLVSADYSS